MAFKKGFMTAEEGAVSLGSEAWNVADGYTKLKILKHLIRLDGYDTLAQFGTEEIDEDFSLSEKYILKRRVEGLQRFVSTLNQLLGNVRFALGKHKEDLVLALKGRIENVEKVLPLCWKEYEDQMNHEPTIEINFELFTKCLKILQDVKDELNFPINEAGLIFRSSDDFDLDSLQREIEEGG